MLPSIKFQHIKNIKFTVFAIPDEEYEYRDGLLLCRNLVVDDRNMTGETLGRRRLQSPHRLFRLKRGYEDFASSPRETLARLYEWMGRPPPEGVDYAAVHPPRPAFCEGDRRWREAAALAGFQEAELATLL